MHFLSANNIFFTLATNRECCFVLWRPVSNLNCRQRNQIICFLVKYLWLTSPLIFSINIHELLTAKFQVCKCFKIKTKIILSYFCPVLFNLFQFKLSHCICYTDFTCWCVRSTGINRYDIALFYINNLLAIFGIFSYV